MLTASTAGIRGRDARRSAPPPLNTRAAGFRGNTCGLSGSHSVRCDQTGAAGRRRSASVAQEYANHDGYVRAVRTAVADLIRERFLLPEDGERYINDATASGTMRTRSGQP
jgi:hypothetical protein